eukprot:CAMPEP_0184019150 /NCGR_PEP_ID=MMETSP0954-20121128/8581_1 /TAXON_ID=627963 /ORGANISM="Aplanochytrium sp, Strain PBS07" /LENGTH=243 /DNA_ID=CAMNT_0026300763 /DNA_START=1247 /DNA_END=1978 /DNA_ORIENTATION=+
MSGATEEQVEGATLLPNDIETNKQSAKVSGTSVVKQDSTSESESAKALDRFGYKRAKTGGTAGIPAPPFYKRRVGNFYVCHERRYEDKDTELLCMVGPCWPMIFVTSGLIIIIPILVCVFVIPEIESQSTYVIVLVFAILALLATTTSYFLIACSNPGIQPIIKDKPGENWTWNPNAESFRPTGVIYEPESGTLINKVDHFCPWTGTVIAENNMGRFVAFNTCVCSLLGFNILIVIGTYMLDW